jgi:type I restriction enzyme R subunit
MAQHNEIAFEQEICKALVDGGWLHSSNSEGYDRELALFPEDVFSWLEETQPEQLAKLVKPGDTAVSQAAAKKDLLRRLAKSLDGPLDIGGGTLTILRRGFKHQTAKFDMCQFKPADNLNEKTLKRYGQNRLRVLQQVRYSAANQNSIDLVLFLNGIPVSTLELKTDFTQSVTDAITQYKNARKPAGEPLLSFGHRALVHFAVSNDEIYMTTKLAGTDTSFLPFNMGDHGRAGNPINPVSSRTAYLWERVLQKDSWLNILGRFMHLSIEKSIDPVSGNKVQKESLLFPRYHQWEAVTELVNTSRAEGPGNKYLIQHSAGSGKTNSIAWTAHQLSTLHREGGKKAFDSVIVVTDRTVLDDQLQEAIKQIDAKTGVVKAVSSNDGAKSRQIASAIAGGTPIIVVTIQSFPEVYKYLDSSKDVAGKSFAIVADEAHSSQTGNTAAKLRNVLSPAEKTDLDDGGEYDMDAALLAEMTGRAAPSNVSFFAFTATPKAKTLEMFGRIVNDGDTPAPFHVYTMQQAIEEGFILDVLQNYTPYKVAFKLTHNGADYESEDIVEQNEAMKSLMRWVRLHPTNIASKVQIIIEHYRQNVAHLLGGKAKAMVVTGSRIEAVRYKLAFEKYIAENKYTNVFPLVAFSGEVEDLDSGPERFTEKSMNPTMKGNNIPTALATDSFQVLLVANKFQTGFDQPLLSAMYVDKKLSGVTAVQTLSRLNRRAPGKDATYVIDFVNDPDDILEAFLPYFRDAQLSDITDPNIVHDMQAKLAHAGIYDTSDVDRVASAALAVKGNNALSAALSPAQDRFWKKLIAAQTEKDRAEEDTLLDFRKTVESFIKAYSFLSQLYNYGDTELEKTFIFLKLLIRLIRGGGRPIIIDLSKVELNALGIKRGADTELSLRDGGTVVLPPLTAQGTGQGHDPVLIALRDAVEQLNELWDDSIYSNGDTKGLAVWVAETAAEQTEIRTQAAANTADQFLESPDLQKATISALIESASNFDAMKDDILGDSQMVARFTKIIGQLAYAIIQNPSKAA